MKKLLSIISIAFLISCSSSRPLVYDNHTSDTIYVDKVKLASKHLASVPVKAGYIILKNGKYYLHGREVSFWKYDPTSRKQFAPHSKQ